MEKHFTNMHPHLNWAETLYVTDVQLSESCLPLGITLGYSLRLDKYELKMKATP